MLNVKKVALRRFCLLNTGGFIDKPVHLFAVKLDHVVNMDGYNSKGHHSDKRVFASLWKGQQFIKENFCASFMLQ